MKSFLKTFILSALFSVLFSVCAFAADADFDGYIIKFKEDAVVLCDDDTLSPVYAPDGIYKVQSLEDAEKFRDMAEFIEPDYTVYLDETYDFSPYDKINIMAASNGSYFQKIGVFGKDINVAVIDSGIYPHNAIKDKIKGGYNVLDSSFNYTNYISVQRQAHRIRRMRHR